MLRALSYDAIPLYMQHSPILTLYVAPWDWGSRGIDVNMKLILLVLL